MARRRIAEWGRILTSLHVDGHVRAYHRKHTIPKAYVMRRRIAAPATTDCWINDHKGELLFVVTTDASTAMSRVLVPMLQEVLNLIGPDRRSTVIFDRSGWSPRLFTEILGMRFDILTYGKGRLGHVGENLKISALSYCGCNRDRAFTAASLTRRSGSSEASLFRTGKTDGSPTAISP